MLSSRLLATPGFSLLGMMVAAGVVGWAGWKWADRAETRRTPPEPRLLQDFSQRLQDELRRLERVYEDDLGDIESVIESDRQGGLAKAAPLGMELRGVRQLSVLTLGKVPPTTHLSVDGKMHSPWPVPVLLSAGERPPKTQCVPLPREDVFPPGRPSVGAGRSGWSRTNGGAWLVHWRVIDDGRVIVELIDRAEVAVATTAHLREWGATEFGPLQSIRATVGVLKSDGSRAFGNFPVKADQTPEFTQTVGNELDTWQLVGWDSLERNEWRDPVRLAGAWSAAGLLMTAGILAFREQRRSMRLAQERVTFVNRVSHELRTPVTNMLLNLDLLRDHLGPLVNGGRSRLDVVTEEAQRLGRLVSNVLTFSRCDREAPDPGLRPCRPDDVIRSVLAQFSPALERRRLEVICALNAREEVRLNADWLAQILSNLISNVEKYAAAGGLLKIHSGLDAGILTVAVEDRGPGIPAGQHDRIFQPFERLSDRVDEGATGTGLGLSIAKDLAVRMGGTLRLADSPVGARFEIQLPAPQVEGVA